MCGEATNPILPLRGSHEPENHLRCSFGRRPWTPGRHGELSQDRLRRSLAGPVTREAVTRSLTVAPNDAGDPGGPEEVSLTLQITFAFNSSALTPQARTDLDGVAAAMNDPRLATVPLTLEGHTDATGADDYNLRLSQRRADAVMRYLLQRGVAAHRLRARGYGEYRPLVGYALTDDRQRRVEIVRAFRR